VGERIGATVAAVHTVTDATAPVSEAEDIGPSPWTRSNLRQMKRKGPQVMIPTSRSRKNWTPLRSTSLMPPCPLMSRKSLAVLWPGDAEATTFTAKAAADSIKGFDKSARVRYNEGN